MTCEEFLEDDVETIIYRPRSYIEIEPGLDITAERTKSTSTSKEKSPKENRHLPSALSEIKNNVLYKVATPRYGRHRSKTTVQKSETVGDWIKNALNRTASLDALKVKSPKLGRSKNKSVEENMNCGFSQLANQRTVTQDHQADVHGQDHRNDHYSKNVFTLKGKDRSQSCPTCPTIAEESESTDYRTVVKSRSYDEANLKKILKNSTATTNTSSCPKIKVEEFHSTSSNEDIYRHSGNWANISNSTSSLSSMSVDKEYCCETVFTVSASQQPTRIKTPTFNDHDQKLLQSKPSSSSMTRPRSLVDIFKRENEKELKLDFLDLNRNQVSFDRNITNKNDDNCLVTLREPRSRSSTFSSELSLASAEKKHRSKKNEASDRRIRAKSMILYPQETNNDNNVNVSSVSNLDVSGAGEHKKSHHKLHAISSPRVLRKLFKKKKHSHPQKEQSPVEKQQVTSHFDEHTRRCMRIESKV